MSNLISIAMVLRQPWRTPGGMARAQEIATRLGIQPTTSGRVSLSAKVSPEVFERLFSVAPTRVAPQPPGPYDFGAPGGYTSEDALTVPAELAEYVESISVISPARRLS